MMGTWRQIWQATLGLLVEHVEQQPPARDVELRRRPSLGTGPKTITEVSGYNVPRTQPGVGHP